MTVVRPNEADATHPQALFDLPHEHGFTGSKQNFRGGAFGVAAAWLCRSLELSALLVPTQSHTNAVLTLRHPEDLTRAFVDSNQGRTPLPTVADAIVIFRSAFAPKADLERLAIGVRTADCVPLLIWTDRAVGAIHAGWRGLANGIIRATVASLPGRVTHVLIGPCAGVEKYEVGLEVPQQIGTSAVTRTIPENTQKLLLDLTATAQNQVRALLSPSENSNVQFFSANQCTISSRAYHSFRREPGTCGSNLTFAVIGPSRSS